MDMPAPIPFLNLKAINERHRLAFREVFERVMDSGWVLLGEETAAFEATFAAYCGVKHCIGYERKIVALKAKFSAEELKRLEERVDYYCKLNTPTPISGNTCIADLKKPKTPKVYYFETYEYARFFNAQQPIDFVFGDVIHIPNMSIC